MSPPRRIRTHTNPLKRFPELTPPDWHSVYADPSLPFALEIGSSKGEFLLEHAKGRPAMNILGAEIRRPLVERLRNIIIASGLRNAWTICGNIEGRFQEFTPNGRIDEVYILFPDPWPKKKHHKRRVIRARMLDELASLMLPGSSIHLMTDHEALCDAIEKTFSERNDFKKAPEVELAARSDWQIHCEETGRPYTRLRYVRT